MDDMNCTKNEDDLEEAEMRLLQRQLDQGQHVTESQEEKDYKAEFFELLDEVNSLTIAYAICSTKIFLAGQKNIWLAKTFWSFIFIKDFDGFGWPNLFWLVKIEFWPAKKILVEQMA